MSVLYTNCFRYRLLLAGALLLWAGMAQSAVSDCVKNTGLSADTAMQGTPLAPLSAAKGVDGKVKKSAAAGSSGVLRMLIPSALRHNGASFDAD